ncbi:hypothetical protein HQ545_04815 [Candidatus Woesearchaeota archaeon]|nr:hypothetical protein [Candidatus Woesearchaeota archaeon]
MTKPEILDEKPITMAHLKEELKRIKKRDEELNFRAEKTEEYLNQFSTITEKKAKEIFKKIEELNIPRIKPEYIVKMIDIMPETSDEVKSLLQGYAITVTKENLKRVADVLKEFK